MCVCVCVVYKKPFLLKEQCENKCSSINGESVEQIQILVFSVSAGRLFILNLPFTGAATEDEKPTTSPPPPLPPLPRPQREHASKRNAGGKIAENVVYDIIRSLGRSGGLQIVDKLPTAPQWNRRSAAAMGCRSSPVFFCNVRQPQGRCNFRQVPVSPAVPSLTVCWFLASLPGGRQGPVTQSWSPVVRSLIIAWTITLELHSAGLPANRETVLTASRRRRRRTLSGVLDPYGGYGGRRNEVVSLPSPPPPPPPNLFFALI